MGLPENPLGPHQRKVGQPTFDEPWQAQALALADTLVEAGILSASEWADALGAELRSSAAAGAADNIDTYYSAVLRAVETLLRRSGITDKAELGSRVEEWRQAYLNTPHGRPVELEAGRR